MGWKLSVAKALLKASRTLTGTTRWMAPVAAGLCDENSLAALAAASWKREEAYRHPSLLEQGLLPFENGWLQRLPPKARVAVIGCGGGRDMLALARRGFSVSGLDVSSDSVDSARIDLAAQNIPVSIFCGDATDFVFPNGPFDAVIFSWLTYGYIPGRNRRIQALLNAVRAMTPGGQVILTLKENNQESLGRALRAARLIAAITGNKFRLESGDNLHERFLYEHHFSEKEIAGEADGAGLKLERWLTLSESHGVNRLAVLAVPAP